MFHGSADSLIPIEWGARTHRDLIAALGAAADVQFVRYNGCEHEILAEELRAFEQFVLGSISPAVP
jgi:predicted esterase